MNATNRRPPAEIELTRKRRLAAMRLQEIEGNPLSAEEIAMFEMFERESSSDEKCRAYILTQAGALAAE
jgi:hypothetical protein